LKKFDGFKRRARRSLFALRGLDLSPFENAKYSYYTQQPTCQIANLWFLYEYFLGKRNDGVFVEVGAFDGIFASNSWGLAARGWTGLLIEPVPEFALKCRKIHSSRKQIKVIDMAIGSVDEEDLTLFLNGTLTTANEIANSEYQEVEWAKSAILGNKIQVKSMTLNTVLKQNAFKPRFDVLMIDVEGFESEVFEGLDLKFWAPSMIIVELADTHPDLTSSRFSHAQLSNFISSNTYRTIFKDSINTVFVRENVWEEAYQN
jgi:FkbM family methyltransferase